MLQPLIPTSDVPIVRSAIKNCGSKLSKCIENTLIVQSSKSKAYYNAGA